MDKTANSIKIRSVCKKEFIPFSSSRKYCGIECREKNQKQKNRRTSLKNKKIKFCKRCKVKKPFASSSWYCAECNKIVLRDQYEMHKGYARKNAKKFYEENKNDFDFKMKRNERYKIYHKKRRDEDPQFKIAIRLRNLLYSALRKYSKEGKAFSSKKYGINFDKILYHLKSFPLNLEEYHIDHIKPLFSFNLEDKEQIRKAFDPKNHQWLKSSENIKKGNKLNWNSS